MKKFLLSIFALCAVVMSASAAKIYVNPGHGSWNTANCRNMRTINYQSYGDTLGFWESNTNMWKCYALQEKLVQAGHTVRCHVLNLVVLVCKIIVLVIRSSLLSPWSLRTGVLITSFLCTLMLRLLMIMEMHT